MNTQPATIWNKLSRIGIVPAIALTGVALSTSPSFAQVTPVASGLNNPRGLAFGPDGTLYVTEAGLGAGNAAGGVTFGVGLTGSLGRISDLSAAQPTYTRFITGLASSATADGVVGPDGVSLIGNGNLSIIMAESTSALQAENPDAPAAVLVQFGRLLQASQGGKWKAVTDVGDFDYDWTTQNANQPWAPRQQFPDANPYAVLALPGHQYVSDAGANTIDEVNEDGSLRIIAYVPNPRLPFGPGGALVPIGDSVPTCVAQGPDGYLYVGTLAFAPYFASGMHPQSKIYRIDPNSSHIFLTEADVWAGGFHPITGCGFGRDAFYVTEFFTAGFGTPGDVIRLDVNADGSAGTRSAMGVHALIAPNGFAAGPDGSIYVSNFSVFPGVNAGPTGQVVRVDY
jgi:hypothetical protein